MASSLEELQEKLSSNPGDDAALSRFEDECVKSGDFAALRAGYVAVAEASDSERIRALIERLAGLAERAGSSGDTPRDGAELLLRASTIREAEPLSDEAGAARSLAAAWGRYPDSRIVDRAWDLIGRPELGRAPDYILAAHAQLAGDGSKVSVRSLDALHVLAGRRLDQQALDEAESLYARLKTHRPSDPRVQRGLETVAELKKSRSEGASKARKAAEKAGKEGPKAAAAWTAYGRAAAAAGDRDAAIEAFETAMKASDAPQAEVALESMLREAGDLERLAEVWARILEPSTSRAGADVSLEHSRQIDLRRKLVRLLQHLGREDEARTQLTLARTVTPPGPDEALAEAARLGQAKKWREAVAVLDAAERATTESDRRHELLLEQARILDQELETPEEAEKVYRRVKLGDPRASAALEFYRRWYVDHGEPRAAYMNLAQLYTILEGDEHLQARIAVAGDMARLAEESLDSSDRAIEAWRRVLADDPTHEEANRQLRRLYTDSERWHQLVEHLESWVRALPEDAVDQKVECLFEIIETYQSDDRLPLDDMVISTYRRIVSLSPSNEKALDRLAQRYEDREKWEELAAVLEHKIEVTEDSAELVDLFGQVAALYLDRIRSPTQAIVALEKLLELDAGNLDVVQKLREIYQQKHDIERLYETYERELELLEGPARQDVLVELATIATDQLFRHDEAVKWWKQVLEIDDKHDKALQALQDLHADQDDWEGYAKVLQDKLEATKTRKDRVETLQELGEIVYARLGDEERARKIFAEITEISPFNTAARSFLQRIYITRRAWDELLELYAPREDFKGYITLLSDFATKLGDTALVADIYVEMARVAGEHLEDQRRVLASLENALEAAPERVDVARRLLELYPDSASASKRMAAVEALARHAEDATEREEAWTQLATLRADHADPRGAFEAFGQALIAGAEVGHVSGIEALEEAAEKAAEKSEGIWEAAASAISEALGKLPETTVDARIRTHRALGHLVRDRLQDTDRAVTHFKWVLQFAPGDRDALDALEEIHLSRNDFEGLEEVLRDRAETIGTEDERLAALGRLGQLYDDVLADPDRASDVYQTILAARPDDEETLGRLRASMAAAEAWPDLAHALEDLLVREEDPKRAATLRLELADLYRERLDDAVAAMVQYRELLDGPEADEDAIVAALQKMFDAGEAAEQVLPLLEDLYRKRGEAEPLLKVLDKKSRLLETPSERLAALNEVALLASDVLGKPEKALAAHMQRFRIDPSDRNTWDELENLAAKVEMFNPVVSLFKDAAKAPGDGDEGLQLERPEDRNALRLKLAGILATHYDAVDDRIALYEAMLADEEPLAAYSPAYDALEELYERKQAWEDLVRVRLEASGKVLSAVARRQKVLDACKVLVARLDRSAEAMDHYQVLFEEDPADAEVSQRLEALYEQAERFEELGKLLEARLEAVPDETSREEVRYELAVVQRDRLDKLKEAVRGFCEIIGSEAVGGPAREALLDMAKTGQLDDKLLGEILEAFDAYYEDKQDDPMGQAEVLLLHAQQAKAGQPRARTLRKAAATLVDAATVSMPDAMARAAREVARGIEEAPDPQDAEQPDIPKDARMLAQRAFAVYARALHEWPGDRDTMDAMDQLASLLGVWDKYIKIMAAVAPKADVPAVAHALWEREALAAEKYLGDTDRAIEAWERLAQNAKASSEESLRAFDNLDRLYKAKGDREARVRVIRMKRASVKKPTVRLPLLSEEARLLHDLGRSDDAMVALRAVLQATQSTQREDMLDQRKGAMTHMAELLDEGARYEDLLNFLLESANEFSDKDPAMARGRLYRAAEVARDKVGDKDRAIEIYERVLTFDEHDEVALTALDRLYQDAKRWEDKARVLAARVEAYSDDALSEERRVLRFTLAQLEEHRLGDPEAALAQYEAILEGDPEFIPAIKALRVMVKREQLAPAARAVLAKAFRDAEEHQDLAETLEARLEAGDVGSEEDRAEVHEELARLYLGPLESPDLAWPHAVAAYKQGPDGKTGRERRDALLTLARARKALHSVPEALAAGARAIEDTGERKARLMQDVEELEGEKIPARALKPLWRGIIEADPYHEPALTALEALAQESGDVDDQADLMAVRIAREETPLEKRSLRLELGRLLSEAGRWRDAAQVYEAMLADDDEDRQAFEALAPLYDDHDESAELVDLIERRIVVAPAEDQAALKRWLARTWWKGMDDPRRAIDIFGALVREDPLDEESRRALEEMWGEGIEREKLLPVLEPLYEGAGDWERLVALLSGLAADEDAEFDLKVSSLEKMARVEEQHLDNTAAAFATMRQLVELRLSRQSAEEVRPAVEALEALAERAEAWDDLLEFYEQVVDRGDADPAFVSHVAELWDTRVGNIDRSVAAYRTALEREPHLAQARDGLTDVLRRAGRFEELQAHLGESAETHLNADGKVTALREQATILRDKLQRPEGAIEPLKRALSFEPDEPLYEELATLYDELGQHEELAAHYRQWLEQVASDERAREIQVRLGLGLMGRDETAAEGLGEIEDVLNTDPGNAAALDGLVEFLDRADAIEAEGGKLGKAQQAASQQAAKTLSAALEQLGESRTAGQQAAMLRAKLRSTKKPAERKPLLTELGALQVGLGRFRDAFEAYAEALTVEPGDEALENDLERLADEQSLHGRLHQVYRGLLDSAKGDAKARYSLKVGIVLARHLGRAEEAAPLLEAAVKRDAGSRDALQLLDAWYGRQRDSDNQARILGMRVEATDDEDQRFELLSRLAILRMDALGDAGGALEALGEVLPRAARDADLRRRLEKLYGMGGDFEGLGQLYTLALKDEALATDERLSLLARKAQIEEVRLGHLDVAAEACRQMLEIEPGHRFALTSLVRIEAGRENWHALDEVLDQRIATTDDDTEKAKLLAHRANVLGAHRDRPTDALELLAKAEALADADAFSDELVAGYAPLLDHEATRLTAARKLEPMYATGNSWDGLRRALAVQADFVTDPEELLKLVLRAAGIDEARRRNVDDALAICAAHLARLAADEDAASKVCRHLEGLAKRHDRWDDVIAMAGDVADGATDEAVGRRFGWWRATLERDRAGRPEDAMTTLEALRGRFPDDEEIRAALEALYRSLGKWDKLRGLMQERLASVDEAERPKVLLDMASMLAEQNSPAAAVPVLGDVLAIEASNPEARRRLRELLKVPEAAPAAAEVLEPVLREEGDWEGVVTALTARLDAAEGPVRATLLVTIGDVWSEQLGKADEAFGAYARALEVAPEDEETLRKIGRVAVAEKSWDAYAKVLEETAGRVESEERKREILLLLAQIVEVKLGSPKNAIATLQEVLKLDRDNRAALAGLRRLFGRLGDKKRLLAVTERAAAVAEDAGKALEIWKELLAVGREMADEDVIMRAAEGCLEVDPYDAAIAQALVPIYRGQKRYDELEKLLVSQSEGAQDPTREAALQLELGKLRGEVLKDVDGAVTAFSTALELDPALKEASTQLETYFREQEDWPRLYDILSKRVEADGIKLDVAIATLLDMAKIAEDELDALSDAVAALERVLELDPGHSRALDELIRIAHRHDMFDKLAALYEKKAETLRAPAEQLQLKVLAAEVYATRLDDQKRAQALAEAVLSAQPDHPKANAVLAQIKAERGQPEQAVKLLETQLGSTKGAARFELLLNLGRLLLDKMDQPASALEYLMQARKLNSRHTELNRLLRGLFEKTGQWQDLGEVLTAEYDVATSDRDKADLALELARLYRERLDDDSGFLEWVVRARPGGKERREVAELLIDYYRDKDQPAEVAPRLEWLVNYLDAKKIVDELPRRAHELAVLLEAAKQADKAHEYYKMAHQADGTYLPNLIDYGRFLMKRGNWDKALRVHQNLMMQSKKLDDAMTDEVLYNLAVASKELGKGAKAKQYLKRLLNKSPDHADAKALLDSL